LGIKGRGIQTGRKRMAFGLGGKSDWERRKRAQTGRKVDWGGK
jgi:hypothetical protein